MGSRISIPSYSSCYQYSSLDKSFVFHFEVKFDFEGALACSVLWVFFQQSLKSLQCKIWAYFSNPLIWNVCLDWKSWPSLVCSARGGPLPWLVESVSSKLQCSNTGNSGNSDIDYITVTALPSTYQRPSTGPDLENMENIF